MIPSEADTYLHHVVNKKMPQGFKQDLEVELFSHIQLKVRKGISISTACRWLHWEGFHYMQHQKALYYDGHNWPDVLEYRHKSFSPTMERYCAPLVEFKIGEVKTEIIKPRNYVKRLLILCAHDESTTQANDGDKEGWVLNGEQPLNKKGPG